MRLAILLALLMLSFYARADTCIITPFEEELAKASTAFIATITSASPDNQAHELRNGKELRVTYQFAVREVFKGKPEAVTLLYTVSTYTDYAPDISWSASDLRLRPGDHALVITSQHGSVQIGSCTLSRPWQENPVRLKALRSLAKTSGAPSNNSFKPKPLRGSA